MSLVVCADRTLAISSGRGHAWALVAEGWPPLPVISWRVELVTLVFVCLWLARGWLWVLRKPGLAGGPHLCIPIKEQSCGPRLAGQGLGAGRGVCLCGCSLLSGVLLCPRRGGKRMRSSWSTVTASRENCSCPFLPVLPCARHHPGRPAALVSFLLMFLARWVSVAVHELSVAVASSSLL